MPMATVEMYEVPIGFITTTSPQTVTTVITVTITDDDDTLQANENADPGASQIFTTSAGTVTSYSLIFDTTVTYTPAGGTGPVTIPVKILSLNVGGVLRYYIMADSGDEIPGLEDGDSIVRGPSRTGYTPIDYEDLQPPVMPCFASGTMLETPTGLRAVEDICVGNLVVTADHGPQPVRWAGSARLDARGLNRRPELRPIRIQSGVLGLGVPGRALLVSPQHRLLLRGWQVELAFGEAEVLAPAKHLIGWPGIDVAHDLTSVTYHHLMFDRHEIVWANGLPAESFLLGDCMREGLPAPQVDEIISLFPNLAQSAPKPARSLARAHEVAALGLRTA